MEIWIYGLIIDIMEINVGGWDGWSRDRKESLWRMPSHSKKILKHGVGGNFENLEWGKTLALVP